MDARGGSPDTAGHDIELSPHHQAQAYKHTSQPGLEPVDYSNLEVVSPRAGLSDHRTWEKDSNLPQVAYRPQVGTPYSSNGVAFSGYEHAAGRDGGGYGGGNGFFQRDAICGIKRQTFWIVMAIGIFVMVAAVAVGVGLGVALHKSDDSSAAPLPSANSSSPNPTTTALPLPTATGTTGPEVVIGCPAHNRTLYAAAGTNRSYLLLCGRDYSSADGATDLFNEAMDSMCDCVDECARQQGCVGAGWGPYNNVNTCWLKSKLGAPNVTPNWYFAVEDEGALKG